MTPEHIHLLQSRIDQVVQLVMLDGTRFIASPLFVYTGEENPDVFVLPAERSAKGDFVMGKAGQSILLADIDSVRLPDAP